MVSAGIVGAVLSGDIAVEWELPAGAISAGGGAAIFVIAYFFNPGMFKDTVGAIGGEG